MTNAARKTVNLEHRRNTSDPSSDAWVDAVADSTASLLSEEGLDLELIVFYDPITETLHAVGYDGAPARYFRSLEVPSDRNPAGLPPRALPEGRALPSLPPATPNPPPAAAPEVRP